MRHTFVIVLLVIPALVMRAESGEIREVVPIDVVGGTPLGSDSNSPYFQLRDGIVELPPFDDASGARALTSVSLRLYAEFGMFGVTVNGSNMPLSGTWEVTGYLFFAGPFNTQAEVDDWEAQPEFAHRLAASSLCNIGCPVMGAGISPVVAVVSNTTSGSAGPGASSSIALTGTEAVDASPNQPYFVDRPSWMYWAAASVYSFPFDTGSVASTTIISGEIEVTFEFTTDASPGDMNCDDTVSIDDVPAFVDSLLGGSAACDSSLADINEDGSIDGVDISEFVQCLAEQGCI